MKAIILRERPIGRYYELPIFESNPKHYINLPDITWSGLLKKANISEKYEYGLIFESNGNDIYDKLRIFLSLDLTDSEISSINAAYFYMLDHPNIKEYEINLL